MTSPTPDPSEPPRIHVPNWLRLFLTAISALVALACLYAGRDLLAPIALAVLIWFLINALANGLAGPPGARRVSIGLAKFVAVAIIFGLMLLAGRIITSNASELGQGLDFGNSAIVAQIRAFVERLGYPELFDIEWPRDRFPPEDLLRETLAYTRALLSDVGLVFLYVLFLLLDERFFDAKLKALVTHGKKRRRISEALGLIGAEASVYLWLMFVLSLGVGLSTYGFCFVFGLAGAGFWGFLAFMLNFIPILGSIAAVMIPSVYALITLTDPVMLVALLACLSATQFVAGAIVLPRVMGDHLNLSSFVILLALVLWGMLWGPIGMFLAIPITVIFTSVCAKFPSCRPLAIILSKDGKLPEAKQ